MKTYIVMKYNRLPKIAKRFPDAVHDIVRKAAYDVEGHAKMVVPVDTGVLKNSIRTEMINKHTAIVATHMEYAAYVEFGTRYQRAKPYMRPAAERVFPGFVEALRWLEGRLA